MRILVVQESDWVERGPHQQHHLIERLQKRGHEVRVIDYEIAWKSKYKRPLISGRTSYTVNGKAEEGARISIVRPAMIKQVLLNYVSLFFTHGVEIYRQLSEFDPHIVVCLGIVNANIAMRLCKIFKKPFVYYLIDALHTLIPERELRFFGRALESNNLRSSDMVFVINQQLRDYAIEMGASKERIMILGAGVDTNRLNPDVDGSEIREKFGMRDGEIILFFMGWLYSFSGIKEVVQSLMGYNGGSKFRAMIVGKGDLYDELLKEKKELGDRLTLIDWQPYSEIPKYIAAADICLLPAYNNEVMKDIVPIKVYEYMACGKPVIATKLPGIVREFGEGNGILYVDGQGDVLVRAAELAKDPEAMRQVGMKAMKFVQKYSWEQLTDQFEEALEDLAGKFSPSTGA